MSSIERYGTTGLTRSVGRQFSRIEATTAIQTAKVDAAAAVTQRALQGAAYLTNTEMQLAESCPAAMSRLKLIGDTGVMGLQQITFDSVTKLGRI